MEMLNVTSGSSTDIARHTPTSQQDMISCLNAVLEGNYRIRLNHEDPLSQTVNRLIEKLERDTQSSLDQMVDLSIDASETTILSARMMSRLNEVDRRSQSIATGAEELEASIDSINHYGDAIVTDVANTHDTIRVSSEAARQTIDTMAHITNAVEQTMEKVRSLETLSKEISEVAETIKGIAFQTNLLSLNANVEAAKAGDAGRGFAVVAKEVGILARRSGEATKAIEEMVKSTHNEIADIVQSMTTSANAVSDGQQAIEVLDSSMRDAQEKIEHVKSSADQIAHTLREQTKAVSLVSSGINDIARATESSASGAKDIVSAMQHLGGSAGQTLEALGSKEVENRVLKLAQSDHISWKKQLVDMAAGLKHLSAHELSNHHSCRLGKWYDSVNDPQLKNTEAFSYLAEPHRLLHEHGKRAVELFNRGDVEGALAEINNVENASEEVVEILRYLDKNASC